MKGKILKFVLVAIILILQAAIAYFLVVSFLIEKPQKATDSVVKKQTQSVGQFLEIKDIVVNPAGTLGRRYLVVEMGLETHDPNLIEEADNKKIWIRDSVISLLTKKSSDELLDITKRKELKTEILQTVNEKLSNGKFERLYFTKYIMQ